MKTKTILLSLLCIVGITTATAQNDVWVWRSGNAVKTAHADSITFTAPVSISGGHAYVDLGLSVKWATCNVGAMWPEDYGDYFAWGETAAKSDYLWATYKFTTDMTKYNATDGKTVLDAEDDAAAANWGGDWRMPTHDEIKELLNTDNCTWEWQAAGNTAFGGVAGYKVTSKKSGYTDKYIFLPAAGSRGGSTFYDVGEYGYFWSATLDAGYTRYAYYLIFSSSGQGWLYSDRRGGRSVRPVCP